MTKDKNKDEKAANDVEKKKKKKRWSFKKSVKYTVYSLIVLGLIGVSTGLFIFYSVMRDIGEIDLNIINNAMSEASIVYDINGNKIGEFESSDSRIIAEFDEIPQTVKDALLAIEDSEFYEHNGFNIKRTIAALLHNIKVGYSAQGGSTITQQLAKGIYLSNEKTLERKIKELCYSLLLEKNLTKDEILCAYLNTMYLGKGSYGVASAAKNYFNKELSELTLAESALLVGITKYPTKYDAYKAQEISAADKDFKSMELVFYDLPRDVTKEDQKVYDKLLENDMITNTQYKTLSDGKKTVYKAVFNPKSKERQEVVLKRMLEVGYISQKEYEEAINQEIVIDVPDEEDSSISSYFVDYVKQEVVSALMKDNYTRDEAMNLLYNGGLKINTSLDLSMQKATEKEFADGSNFPSTQYNSSGIAQPQGAMVIIDYKTGQIRAMVGGRGINGNGLYNRAINARQPGSTIKPIAVYLPALMRTNIYPNSIVEDEPVYLSGSDKPYPNNYMKKYRGNITLTDAVKHSSNVVAAKTLLSLADKPSEAYKISIDFMEELGISTLVRKADSPAYNDENLPLALGGLTKGISPLEMAAAYGTIANNGVYIKPIAVLSISDRDDNILFEATTEKKQVFSEQVAQRMTEMLEAVVDSGTATRAKLPNGISSAGKTGTTSDSKDIWYVGYSPYLVGATWIGHDQPKELNAGSSTAVRLWSAVMNNLHEDLPTKKFYDKKDFVEASICSETGRLANKKCKLLGHSISTKFKKGTAPTKSCTKHKYTEYDAWLEKQKEEEKKEEENNTSEDNNSSSGNSSSNGSSSSNESSSSSGNNPSNESSSSSGDSSSNGSSSSGDVISNGDSNGSSDSE